MPAASWAQTSFLGGVWSKTAQGRFDDPAYRIALNVCLNMIPIEAGAATRRPGTQFSGTTRNGNPARCITFAVKQSSPITMEFTDGFMRFRSGVSIMTNSNAGVVSISTANPAVVTVSSAQTWSTGDQGFFTFLGTTCPLLQNRLFSLTKVDTTHFSLSDPVTGATIDGSTLGVGSLAPATVLNHILDIATSFTGSSRQNLRSVQAETETVLLSGTPPQVFLAPTPSSPSSFSLNPATFIDGPYLDPVTTGETLTPGSTSGSITLTASGSNFGGFAATDVGRSIRLFSEPALWNNTGLGYSVGNVVKYNNTYWTALKNSASGDAGTFLSHPGVYADEWSLTPTGAQWFWATIQTVSSPTVVIVTLTSTLGVPGTTGLGSTLLYTVPIVTWRLGVYSNTTSYPTCGCYHEGRIWLAGAVDNRVDSGTSNGVSGINLNFAPTDAFGNVTDAHAISYIFNASDVNPILWMRSIAEGIACGTQAGEWVIQATSLNEPLTPTSMQAHRRTRIGCAFIEPVDTEHTLVFVQAFLRKIMELFPDVFSGKFTAPNLLRDAKHLSVGGIAELAYQRELSPTIWARLVNGGLISGTYKRDTLMTSQGPTINGWVPHALGSGRIVESICVGPSPDGTIDALTMVTNDPTTNVRHVEVMTNLWEEGTALPSAWYLDDAVRPSSFTVTAGTYTLVINGLWHLNGKTVAAFVAGIDAGNYTVANGSITVALDGSANPLLNLVVTPGQVPPSALIVVGFPYNSDGQVLRLAQQKESGVATGAALGKMQRAQEYAVLVTDTSGGNSGNGLLVGTDFNVPSAGVPGTLMPALFRQFYPSTANLAENILYSGVHRAPLKSPYSIDNDRLTWRSPRMYPLTIGAVNLFQDAET